MQVTPLAAAVMARSYGAATVTPQTRPVFGVPEVAAPLEGRSVLMEWNYTFVDPVPVGDQPPDSATDTHECVRREPAAMRQVGAFVASGGNIVTQTCVGAHGCTATRCCGGYGDVGAAVVATCKL